MQQFIKKVSIPVQAEQYLNGSTFPPLLFHPNPNDTDQRPCLSTIRGMVRVDNGDWIIYGRSHDIYPCPADVFERLYEPFEGQLHSIAASEVE